MFRVTTVSNSPEGVHLNVEGRLVRDWGEELFKAGQAPLKTGRKVVLDLSGVAFADDAGLRALKRLRESGAVLVGCSLYLKQRLQIDC
jgi:anti-anti-sigma regulatory factor